VFSKNEKFQKGDLVLCGGGWQKYAVLNGKELSKLPKNITNP